MASGTEQKHTALFGRSPEAVLSAPGRTELCGNHTDHQSGRVIAAAIRRSITAAVSPRADGKCLLHTGIGAFEVTLSTLAPAQGERGASAALVRGVAEYFAAHSLNIGGFNAAIESDIPIGSGVSSSAAFEVLIGRIFNALYNNGSAEPMTIALAAQYAENAHFGKPCGLMDQAACALGGVQFIDFFDNAAPNVSALEWPFTNDFAIYIINTGSSHADMADAYTQITADMKSVSDILGVDRLGHADEAEFMRRLGEIRRAAGDRTAMRALHFFGENARVGDMAAAIRSADAAALRAQCRRLFHAARRTASRGIWKAFSAKEALFGQYKGHIINGCLMGGHKTVNGAYRHNLMPACYVTGCSPLALPLGELSPQVTERALQSF